MDGQLLAECDVWMQFQHADVPAHAITTLMQPVSLALFLSYVNQCNMQTVKTNTLLDT